MTPQQLKSLRASKSLNQEELAAELGVSVHTVRSWEQGKNPIPAYIEKLLLKEVDLNAPIDLIQEIGDIAEATGLSFRETLSTSLRLGMEALKERALTPLDAATKKK